MSTLTARPQIRIWNDVPCPVLKRQIFVSPISDFRIAVEIGEGIPKSFVVRRVKIGYEKLISSDFYRLLSGLASHHKTFLCTPVYMDYLQPIYRVQISDLNGNSCILKVITKNYSPHKRTSQYFSIIN